MTKLIWSIIHRTPLIDAVVATGIIYKHFSSSGLGGPCNGDETAWLRDSLQLEICQGEGRGKWKVLHPAVIDQKRLRVKIIFT